MGKILYNLRVKAGVWLALICFFAAACNPVNTDPPERPVRSKTVLLYLAGNNNLWYDIQNNIRELYKGYIPDENAGNLIVYQHLQYDAGGQGKPKLLRIYRNGEGAVVTDTVYRFPHTNSALASSLKSAIQVTTTLFPAEEYGLLLSSHGTGWLPSKYYASGAFPESSAIGQGAPSGYRSPWPDPPGGIDPYAHLVKTFAADDSGDTEIEIIDMVKALPHKFNYIIMDACFMGGIETAYEIKDSTDYLVFSPAEVLASGFNYAGMMQYLFKSPADLRGFASSVYDYYNSQSGLSHSLTISVVKTSELENVASAAENIFSRYGGNIAGMDVTKIQRYFRYSNKQWFFDINDFIRQLCGTEGAADAQAFSAALEKAVIFKLTTGRILDLTIDKQKYSGICTYIPYHPVNEKLDAFYRNFAWEKKVGMVPDASVEE